MKQGDNGEPLYTDIKIVLPLTIIVLILLSSGTSTVICLKSSKSGIVCNCFYKLLTYTSGNPITLNFTCVLTKFEQIVKSDIAKK